MTASSTLRSLAWRHPEWWVWVVAGAAWAALALVAAPVGSAHGHAHGSVDELPSPLVVAALMSVAMMAPLATPTARYVAVTTFRSRRQRAQATFLAGYLATWTAVTLATGAAVAGVAGSAGPGAAVGAAFAGAAAWQLARPKRRALKRCRMVPALAAEGWRATRDCMGFGVVHGARCTATCGCLMAAAAAAGHSLPVMAGVFALQLHERATRSYRPRASAGALAVLGIVVAVA